MKNTNSNFESNKTNRVHRAERCTVAETISAASDQIHRNQRRPAKKLGWTLEQKRRLVKLDNEEKAKGKGFKEKMKSRWDEEFPNTNHTAKKTSQQMIGYSDQRTLMLDIL